MHIHAHRLPPLPHDHARRGLLRLRQLIALQPRFANSGQRSFDLRCHGCHGAGRLQLVVSPFTPGFQFRLKKIDSAAERQHHHKRDAEQPGIKMPAPHRPIIGPLLRACPGKKTHRPPRLKMPSIPCSVPLFSPPVQSPWPATSPPLMLWSARSVAVSIPSASPFTRPSPKSTLALPG